MIDSGVAVRGGLEGGCDSVGSEGCGGYRGVLARKSKPLVMAASP